jgi:cation transport ATPase
MRIVLGLILLAMPLSAELRKVEMKLTGLDCESCALSVDGRFKRMRGVDAATFDSKTKVLTVTFKLENKVPLSAIRDAAKSIGYTPGEVHVIARGSLTPDGAQWQFQVSGPDTKWAAELPEDLRKNAGANVLVDGIIPDKAPEVLRIKSVVPAE